MARRSVVLALLFLLTAVSAGGAQDQHAVPQTSQWAEFQYPDRGFVIAFPGTPQITSTPVRGQNPLMQHEFQVSLGDDTSIAWWCSNILTVRRRSPTPIIT
jgi:hypothetical protein